MLLVWQAPRERHSHLKNKSKHTRNIRNTRPNTRLDERHLLICTLKLASLQGLQNYKNKKGKDFAPPPPPPAEREYHPLRIIKSNLKSVEKNVVEKTLKIYYDKVVNLLQGVCIILIPHVLLEDLVFRGSCSNPRSTEKIKYDEKETFKTMIKLFFLLAVTRCDRFTRRLYSHVRNVYSTISKRTWLGECITRSKYLKNGFRHQNVNLILHLTYYNWLKKTISIFLSLIIRAVL